MPHFLISGIAGLAEDVAGVLREHGSTAVVSDLAGVPAVVAETGPGAFDGYIQLPSNFVGHGETVVRRIHHFFRDGVLARFPAVDAALPALTDPAKLVFVMGILPPEVHTADDVTARSALVAILARAARSEAAGKLSISVIGPSTPSAKEIAEHALGIDESRTLSAADVSDDNYADWRVELLGLASIQV